MVLTNSKIPNHFRTFSYISHVNYIFLIFWFWGIFTSSRCFFHLLFTYKYISSIYSCISRDLAVQTYITTICGTSGLVICIMTFLCQWDCTSVGLWVLTGPYDSSTRDFDSGPSLQTAGRLLHGLSIRPLSPSEVYGQMINARHIFGDHSQTRYE